MNMEKGDMNMKDKAATPVEMHAKQTANGPESTIYKQRNPVMKSGDLPLSKFNAFSNIPV